MQGREKLMRECDRDMAYFEQTWDPENPTTLFKVRTHDIPLFARFEYDLPPVIVLRQFYCPLAYVNVVVRFEDLHYLGIDISDYNAIEKRIRIGSKEYFEHWAIEISNIDVAYRCLAWANPVDPVD